MPHLMQASWLIAWGFFFSPVMAFCGQFRLQAVQPLHFSGSMENVISALHTPAGHFLSLIWASYSCRKYLSVESTGLGTVLPSPHSDASRTTEQSSSRIGMCADRKSTRLNSSHQLISYA